MSKVLWALAVLIWIATLSILIIALTNIWPDNPFSSYGFLIGLGLITLSGLMRTAYQKSKK